MSDYRKTLAEMRRPGLLMRAVRHGLREAPRGARLRRLAGAEPTAEARISRLIDTEARMEATRQAGDAAYSVPRHIEVLVALMAEARGLIAPGAGGGLPPGAGGGLPPVAGPAPAAG